MDSPTFTIVKPVSYTHLDVYKRQEQIREIERVILLKVIDNKWMSHIDDMDQLRPVSYTHLDVYKRQAQAPW